MVLVKGFRATTIWKAFLIYSIVSSVTIVLALVIKGRFDTFTGAKDADQEIKQTTNWLSILLTLLGAFVASFVTFTFMYFVFGFGKGLLVLA